MLRLLIESGANWNLFNYDGLAPVHEVWFDEQLGGIQYMIELNRIYKRKIFDFELKGLFKEILNLDIPQNNTPMHIAAGLGSFKLILELSRTKPNVMILNKEFQTPFQVCKRILVCTKLIKKLENIKSTQPKVKPNYVTYSIYFYRYSVLSLSSLQLMIF